MKKRKIHDANSLHISFFPIVSNERFPINYENIHKQTNRKKKQQIVAAVAVCYASSYNLFSL